MSRVPSASHEGPFTSATIVAVKNRSDTGSLRRWWLTKVEKSTQLICVSSATTRRWCSKASRFWKMRRGKGKKEYRVSGSPNDAGKGFIATRDGSWEEFEEGCRERENSSEWTLEKIREAYEKVARDEVGHCARNPEKNVRTS